ncbi:MAG: hypothetical protein FKY71_13870 [Spiribacter salinus]|uniref:Uncharacterized protein n=1 Tax=Spiribacter salinus TaxID=1335746 RepID=A0A540VNZ6_9GAMM|nr:MAG: hypothetical protein FKY71_13870 [Spiribacter salinus]
MNARPHIRRAIGAMKRNQPIPKDVAAVLAPALEAAISRPAEPFEQGAGLVVSAEDREAQQALIRLAASKMRGSASWKAECMLSAVRGLDSFVDDPDAHLVIDGWRFDLLRALRIADLPKKRTLQKHAKQT